MINFSTPEKMFWKYKTQNTQNTQNEPKLPKRFNSAVFLNEARGGGGALRSFSFEYVPT